MLIETLDFEEPIAVLLQEIEALSMLPRTTGRQQEIVSLCPILVVGHRYAKFRRMGNVGLREAPASEVGPVPEPAGT